MDDEEFEKLPVMSMEEISLKRGLDENEPILLVIDRKVFDVSSGRIFYGPEGKYHLFAGRDCTRALALGSFLEEDLVGNKSKLTMAQLMKLDEWLDTFEQKYPIVARVHEDSSNSNKL